MKRITLRDIAISLKLHHTTVSRALRNDRRIPPDTIERIRRKADELGYRPDPMMSALMSYRGQTMRRSFHATLAWVTNYPTQQGWRQYERNAYFRGATRRAGELGYLLDEFWLNEPGISANRASQIFRSRNIQGLLLIPQPRSRGHLNINWEYFSAVTFGRTLAKPEIHNVDNDHYKSMAILMRQLKRRGYRKIAFAIWPRINESNDRAWTAAYWAFQTMLPQKQIPVFMEKPPWEKKRFEHWIKKFKPDVLISHSELPYLWLQEMGFHIPRDIGFVMAAKPEEFSARYSGIDENNELVGEIAVSFLVQMINRGEMGIPNIPISTLVEGSWITGDTVRKLL